MIANPRIALVEDSQADQFLFCKLLRQVLPEAQVDIYSSIGEFRMALQAHSYECVVLDNRLPDGSGLDLLNEIRNVEELSTLPAIVLTGSGDEATAVKAMKWGASDYMPKSKLDQNSLESALNGAFAAARREQSKRENDARLKQQALTDGLTGVFNRRAFDEAVVSLDKNGGCPALALMYLDLDAFKEVNDVLGHAAGDEVLRVISQRLHAVVRGSDIVYRLGGDEFAIILLPPPRGHDLEVISDRVKAALYQPVFNANGTQIFAGGGSIGVASREDGGEALSTLVERADQAMYTAKSQGGGVQLVQQPRHESPQAAG